MRKLWQKSKVRTGEGVSSRWDHIRKRRGYFKYVYVRTRGDVGRIEKLVLRSAQIKWMAPNKCHVIFSVYWSGQVPYLITSKHNVIVFFFCHNTSCTIVLTYATIMIIRIYSLYLSICRSLKLRGWQNCI